MSDTTNDPNDLMRNEVVRLIQNIGNELNISAQESVKFVQGNKSAGTRIRRVMQNIKKLAQEVRVEVQSQKKKAAV